MAGITRAGSAHRDPWRSNSLAFMTLLPLLCVILLANVATLANASHKQLKVNDYTSMASPRASPDLTTYKLFQSYRSKFHFQPRKNWMNDPNGPIFYKGWYHVFFQYNPDAAVWGNITWGHAVSKDLIDWRYLHTALKGDHWYDIQGVWSGSATFLDNGTPVLLYTGWSNASQQIQSMALPEDPSDPLLRRWKKAPHNPVALAPKGYNSSQFRDPTTAWKGDDGVWRILVGANRGEGGLIGTALLYKSRDFVTWSFSETPLHSVETTGMWECPDFYPVHISQKLGLETSADRPDVKHVLKVSLDLKKHDYYSVGNYNSTTDTYEPEDPNLDTGLGLRYDYGKFYASKTFYDQNKNRRILWGWANESSSAQEDIEKGWSSVQCLPRQVWLDSRTSTNLIQWPVEEVESLRYNAITAKDLRLKAGSTLQLKGVNGAQLDIEVHFAMPNKSPVEEAPELLAETGQLTCSQLVAAGQAQTLGHFGPFGVHVLATEDLQERTSLFFHLIHSPKNGWNALACSDQSKSSIAQNLDKTVYGSYVRLHEEDETLSFRILVDHSIVESFAQGGRTVVTSRVYPTLLQANMESALVFLFNEGTEEVVVQSVSTWNMKDADLRDL